MSNTDPTDTAITAAFEELRREVSLTRAALEGLTAARERIPDYSATLGQIAERLKATMLLADRIEKAPAIKLSPDAMAAEIVMAGEAARAADARLIQQASQALSFNCGQIDLLIRRGKAPDEQKLHILYGVCGGILGGIALWPILIWTVEHVVALI